MESLQMERMGPTTHSLGSLRFNGTFSLGLASPVRLQDCKTAFGYDNSANWFSTKAV